MKKLLLHVCCAPCGLYVYEKLRQEYDVRGFFHNPNIHPQKEYEFRKDELMRIAEIYYWDIVYADYNMKDWFSFVKGYENEPEKGKRCSLCYNFRLQETFKYASNEGFNIVTSTLSISPHKNTDQINVEGFLLGEEYGIEFLGESFKKKNGCNIGREMGRKVDVKRQDYCGCAYSKAERIKYNRSKVNLS